MKFFKTVKENLKDPKKKSLTLLGLYALFFIFVFILLNSSGNSNNIKIPDIPNEQVYSTKENYKNMSSYQYNINFIGNNFIDTVGGTYYKNTSLFTYNSNKYFYEDGLLYVINGNYYSLTVLEHNIHKLFNNSLSNILDKLQEEYKTTYTDGRVRTNYKMDSNDFFKFYFDAESNYNTNIEVEIEEFNNNITNILINLANLNLEVIRIEIDYSNINKISSLEFNKNDYYLESRDL